MAEKLVCGKTTEAWRQENPVIDDICNLKETVWINPHLVPFKDFLAGSELDLNDVKDASERLDRFAPYLKLAFPQTAASGGIIESPLRAVPAMQEHLSQMCGTALPGRLMAKLDSHLAISGSIKARGGIYEVLKTAEDIALKEGLLNPRDSYEQFAKQQFTETFSRYSIAVGSTGNLGLSIGIMGAKLGFRVTVHMSADARSWKKDLLRSKGVTVIEYGSDYSYAVAEGRKAAQHDPYCHFVDDENSRTLFLGYAVAGLRLKKQLDDLAIAVDQEHPLFVYLPCGVGGGPGGVAFGLKLALGDAVHCFFAEPTHSCCMTLGLASGLHNAICVQDFGLDNETAADGLAVGRASGFVGRFVHSFLSGCYTLSDDRMFSLLARLADTENILLEPSALAGMFGPVLCATRSEFKEYIESRGLLNAMPNATHIAWATGGSMVPHQEMQTYYNKALGIKAL